MTRLFHTVFPINALPAAQLVSEGIDVISHRTDIKLKAVERYYEQLDADLLFCFSDIVIQADAMGAKIAFARDSMPAVKRPAAQLLQAKVSSHPRMRVNAEVIRGLRRTFPDRPVAAMVYGPFTVAGQVAGEQHVLRAVLENPAEVHALLEKALACANDYADLLLSAGGSLLWVSDPLASLLPPEFFTEFAGEPLARLFLRHDTTSALHICGDTTRIVTDMVRTGVDGISFDQCMELTTIEDTVPDTVAIIGNLDPVEVLELAKSKYVAEATAGLVTVMGIKNNFCLSSGCAPPPTTPLANLISFVQTGHRALADITKWRKELEIITVNVHSGQRQELAEKIPKLLMGDIDPMLLLNSGLMRAIRKGSARYEAHFCYLPEILLMVDAFYEGYQLIRPRLDLIDEAPPQIALGTVKGDIHEIGKDLVKILQETAGVKVLDLGVNVEPERFLAAHLEKGIPIIGLSAFNTSSRKQVEQIVKLFRQHDCSQAVILTGGAAMNQQIAAGLGCHGYARDAVTAVSLVKKWLAKS
ncbi:MAG: uroporphyrinogen decarboxylase family protein [Pseudomonadota bacterium]